MSRRLIVLSLVAGAVLLWAAPAQAKGPFFHDSLSGTVKIEGPNMRIPIVLGWKGDCGLFFPCSDLKYLDNDFLTLARDTALGAYVPDYARTYYPVPTKSQLGPAYDIHWTLITERGKRAEIDQILYPFAEGRPWVFTPPGQVVRELEIQEDPLSAPPSILGLLQKYGFPANAAVVGTAAGAAATAASPRSSGLPWVWIVTIGAMSLLLIGGAMAGRRRETVQTV